MEINLRDASGWTALHMACSEGNVEVVTWLLQHGSSVHMRDKLGNTPLSVAIQNDHHKVFAIDYEYKIAYFLWAISYISSRCDWNRVFGILLEIKCGIYLQVIRLLIQTGAHLTETPLRLGEALVTAAAANNTHRLKSYHLADVDLSFSDPCGRTALHAVSILPLTSKRFCYFCTHQMF